MAGKLSVALAAYNGAPHLAEQMASIAAQTRLPDELVVSDDCSSDDTVAICREFAAGAPFPVRVLESGVNRGIVANFEVAIAACDGDVIALADQDDIWLPMKLARMEEVFRSSPETVLAFSDAVVVGPDLEPLGYRLWNYYRFDDRRRDRVLHGRAFPELLTSYFVTGSTLAFRSSWRRWFLPLPTDLGPVIHDGWMALVAAAGGQIVPVDQALILYRQHAGQAIGADIDADRLRGRNDAGRLTPLSFAPELLRLRTLRDRIAGPGFPALTGPWLEELDSRIAHWERRSALPRGLASRTVVVARELTAGKYHRYSAGLRSALKDVVAGPATGKGAGR